MYLDIGITGQFRAEMKAFVDQWDGPPATREELTNFLNNHERLHFVLKNLGAQLEGFETKFGKEASLMKRNEIIKMSARHFAYVAIKHRTDINKSRLALIQEENDELNKRRAMGLAAPDTSSLKGQILEVNADGSTQEIN